MIRSTQKSGCDFPHTSSPVDSHDEVGRESIDAAPSTSIRASPDRPGRPGSSEYMADTTGFAWSCVTTARSAEDLFRHF